MIFVCFPGFTVKSLPPRTADRHMKCEGNTSKSACLFAGTFCMLCITTGFIGFFYYFHELSTSCRRLVIEPYSYFDTDSPKVIGDHNSTNPNDISDVFSTIHVRVCMRTYHCVHIRMAGGNATKPNEHGLIFGRS